LIQVRYADGERECLGVVEYKLFVGSLNKQAPIKEVEEIFSKYGQVEDVYLMHDEKKQSPGCGFVKYSHKIWLWQLLMHLMEFTQLTAARATCVNIWQNHIQDFVSSHHAWDKHIQLGHILRKFPQLPLREPACSKSPQITCTQLHQGIPFHHQHIALVSNQHL